MSDNSNMLIIMKETETVSKKFLNKKNIIPFAIIDAFQLISQPLMKPAHAAS